MKNILIILLSIFVSACFGDDTKEVEKIVKETFSLNITISPPEKATITLDPNKDYYEKDELVSINIDYQDDYSFYKWDGSNASDIIENQIIMNSDKSLILKSKNEITNIPFSIAGDYLTYWDGYQYNPFFIKGVNLGVGVPGRYPGELAPTKEDYLNWFAIIHEAGFNSIRIYTLHFPRFYEALYEFNSSHNKNPIYVFHGVWLDEYNPEQDLYAMTDIFEDNIREVVDCSYGNRTITQRAGEAYGEYTYDISKWVISWIIGREISSEEAINTDNNNSSKTSFTGNYFKVENTNPSSVWALERLDYIADYEAENYGNYRPVAISNWPTLDPITHITEPSSSREDLTTIDLSNVEILNENASMYATYHAYSYYPDFINNDPIYTSYRDYLGINNYLGYLYDLKDTYKNIPLLISEFGVPSSWGNAHGSPSGMGHGGHDELMQGIYNARMMQNIYDTNCAGGIVFALFDEWWKRAWINDLLTYPRERYALWHDLTNPEQNFGLIAFEPVNQNNFTGYQLDSSGNYISSIAANSDRKFLYFEIYFNENISPEENIIIGIDTYGDDIGESILPDGKTIKNRAEFSLNIMYPYDAKLYVTEAYDLFGIWHRRSYTSEKSDGGKWNLVSWKNNSSTSNDSGDYYNPEVKQDIGILSTRPVGYTSSSVDAVIFSDNKISIKLPWTMLQFSDPSQINVVNGLENSTESDGVSLSVSYKDTITETNRYTWEKWNIAGEYTERKKESFEIFSEKLKELE